MKRQAFLIPAVGIIGFALGMVVASPGVFATKSPSPKSVPPPSTEAKVDTSKALLTRTFEFQDNGEIYLNFCAIYPEKVVKRYFRADKYMFETSEQVALGPRVPEMINNLYDAKEGDISKGNYNWAYLRSHVKRNLALDHIDNKSAKVLKKIIANICSG